MTQRCKKGDWVEIHYIILPAGERAKDVPEDTSKVPFEAWLKGWALTSAEKGEELEIETPAGRKVKGILTEVDPGYTHSYGPSVPELSSIGRELKAMLKGEASRG